MIESARPDDLVPRAAPLPGLAHAIPHPDPFVLDLLVRGGHLSDTIDHVSNIEYVRWLDRAAELHADALGYTRRRLLDDGVMWFVLRHEIDYRAEAWLDDALVLATWVGAMHRTTCRRHHLLVRPDDTPQGHTIVCLAETVWVLVNLASRRPIRVPPDMARAFAPIATFERSAPRRATARDDTSCTSR